MVCVGGGLMREKVDRSEDETLKMVDEKEGSADVVLGETGWGGVESGDYVERERRLGGGSGEDLMSDGCGREVWWGGGGLSWEGAEVVKWGFAWDRGGGNGGRDV